jgi:hypothetical protein
MSFLLDVIIGPEACRHCSRPIEADALVAFRRVAGGPLTELWALECAEAEIRGGGLDVVIPFVPVSP